MKKLKAQQKQYCTFCKQQGQKTPAVWRSQSMTLNYAACGAHREALASAEKANRSNDSHLSEADYATWYNL